MRELVAEGDTPELISEHLHDLGLQCTPRQVRRWKVVHKIRRQWAGGDAALDGIVQQLVANDELGDDAAAPLPTAERAWKDVKLHRGARGEFRQLYGVASQGRATAGRR